MLPRGAKVLDNFLFVWVISLVIGQYYSWFRFAYKQNWCIDLFSSSLLVSVCIHTELMYWFVLKFSIGFGVHTYRTDVLICHSLGLFSSSLLVSVCIHTELMYWFVTALVCSQVLYWFRFAYTQNWCIDLSQPWFVLKFSIGFGLHTHRTDVLICHSLGLFSSSLLVSVCIHTELMYWFVTALVCSQVLYWFRFAYTQNWCIDLSQPWFVLKFSIGFGVHTYRTDVLICHSLGLFSSSLLVSVCIHTELMYWFVTALVCSQVLYWFRFAYIQNWCIDLSQPWFVLKFSIGFGVHTYRTDVLICHSLGLFSSSLLVSVCIHTELMYWFVTALVCSQVLYSVSLHDDSPVLFPLKYCHLLAPIDCFV